MESYKNMSKKLIAPVLKMTGSKFNKIDPILKIFNFQDHDCFLDMFGGTGIIGINVKHLRNIPVTINDYDKILPVSESHAIKNMLSYGGLNKNFTKIALKYFNIRIKNDYWNKLIFYNKVLEKVDILHLDFKKIVLKNYSKIYVDPPYYGVNKNLYKNSEIDHVELNKILEEEKDQRDILISYNECQFIVDLYKNWYIYSSHFKYSGMGNNKDVRELFISNFKIEGIKGFVELTAYKNGKRRPENPKWNW